MLYVFIADTIDDPNAINFKIKKIASLFNDMYSELIRDFSGEVSRFNDFKDVLIDMNLAQRNCGGRPECEGCPNSDKTNVVLNNFKEDKKGFLNRFKSLFKKSKSIKIV